MPHNFYGDFKDALTPPTSRTFRLSGEQYYAPNNAVLAVVGDVKPGRRLREGARNISARFLSAKFHRSRNLVEKPQASGAAV